MLRAPVAITIAAAHFSIAAVGIDAPGSAVAAAGVRAVQCKGCFGRETLASEELPDVVAQQGRSGCVGPLKVKDVAAAAAGGRLRAGNAEAGGDLAQRGLFCEVDEEIVDEFVGKQVIDLAQRGETESVKVCRIGGHSRSQAGWEGCAEEEEEQHGLHLGSKMLRPPLVFFNPRLPLKEKAEEKHKQGDEGDFSAAVFIFSFLPRPCVRRAKSKGKRRPCFGLLTTLVDFSAQSRPLMTSY